MKKIKFIFLCSLFLIIGCSRRSNLIEITSNSNTKNFFNLQDTLTVLIGIRNFESLENLTKILYPGFKILEKKHLFFSNIIKNEAFYEVKIVKIDYKEIIN